jgi:hypothetical protein
VCAHDVERRFATGEGPEERLLESSEVDDCWRRLRRESRGIVCELAPGELWIDAVPHHRLRDACDPRDRWWNFLVS